SFWYTQLPAASADDGRTPRGGATEEEFAVPASIKCGTWHSPEGQRDRSAKRAIAAFHHVPVLVLVLFITRAFCQNGDISTAKLSLSPFLPSPFILLLQWSLNRASAGRTRSGQYTVQRWISDLLFSAISGALIGLLLDFLGSRLVPQYWGPGDPWGVAGFGALGAMLYQCFQGNAERSRR